MAIGRSVMSPCLNNAHRYSPSPLHYCYYFRPLPATSLIYSAFFTSAGARRKPLHSTLRASSDDDQQQQEAPVVRDAEFEARLARLRRKVRTGTAKKAQRRGSRKEGLDSSFAKAKDGVLIPLVPLKEPVSDWLKVQLGFSPYAERLNGRLAALGLVAVLLVELATGSSFIKYHEPVILGIQVYFVLGVSALFIKYEKEKGSVWPKQ